MRFSFRSLLIGAALAAPLLAGCSRTSPAVGTWTMTAGAQPVTLTLQKDGTGTLQPPVGTQQPVSWTEQEKAVTLQVGGAAAADGSAPPGGAGLALTGTLSEDNKTMTVPFGPVTLTLQKQPDGE